MGSVFGTVEVHHAIQARKRRAAAGISVVVKFLLGQDVSAVLEGRARSVITAHDGR